MTVEAMPELMSEGDAFVVMVNTDLTEGRGREYPAYVCKLKSTASRLGAGRGVQGSDCAIRKVTLYRINGELYGPVKLELPTTADEGIEKARLAKEAVVQKALEAGLTPEDIALLQKK